MSTRRRWDEASIQAELRPIVADLGRMPTRAELNQRGLRGLWNAMGRLGGLAVWRERMAGATTLTAVAVTREDVARGAYFLALERGGDPVENWLAAERALLAAR